MFLQATRPASQATAPAVCAFRGRFFRGAAAKFPSWEGLGVGSGVPCCPDLLLPTPCPSQDGNLASVPEVHFKKPTLVRAMCARLAERFARAHTG